jgi:hypothetical protein
VRDLDTLPRQEEEIFKTPDKNIVQWQDPRFCLPKEQQQLAKTAKKGRPISGQV